MIHTSVHEFNHQVIVFVYEGPVFHPRTFSTNGNTTVTANCVYLVIDIDQTHSHLDSCKIHLNINLTMYMYFDCT